MNTTLEREQRMYDALRRISKGYMTPEQIRRDSERQGALSYEEYLEMAYENVRQEATTAIRGMRRPAARKVKP